MEVLAKTKDLSRREWLSYRLMGVGGSDVSVIAGISPFKSAYELWLEKTGQAEPEEAQNEYTHFGAVLEPVVKNEFMARTGKKVRAKNMLLKSTEHPFMIADLDGVIYEDGGMAVFEAKTASAYKQDVWENGVPAEYVLQVQHYMAVTGAARTYIAALVGGNHFYHYAVERDDKMIAKIIAMEQHFWEKHVLAGTAPEPDGSDAATAYLNRRFAGCNGESIELSEEAAAACEEYAALLRQLKEVETAKNAAANRIKSCLGENERGTAGGHTVTWKPVVKSSIDTARLKAEQPDIYSAYLTETRYRRLSVA